MKISKDTVVSLNYTLKNSEGLLIDTTEGRSPLVYLHGFGALVPGLENGLEGKERGAKFTVIVTPDEGFGRKSDEFFHVVSKDGFQGDEEMEIGMQVQLDTDHGPRIATISKIEGNDVTLDLNHPLADMELHFEIDVVELRPATAEELAHGHVHGPGGHHH